MPKLGLCHPWPSYIGTFRLMGHFGTTGAGHGRAPLAAWMLDEGAERRNSRAKPCRGEVAWWGLLGPAWPSTDADWKASDFDLGAALQDLAQLAILTHQVWWDPNDSNDDSFDLFWGCCLNLCWRCGRLPIEVVYGVYINVNIPICFVTDTYYNWTSYVHNFPHISYLKNPLWLQNHDWMRAFVFGKLLFGYHWMNSNNLTTTEIHRWWFERGIIPFYGLNSG